MRDIITITIFLGLALVGSLVVGIFLEALHGV